MAASSKTNGHLCARASSFEADGLVPSVLPDASTDFELEHKNRPSPWLFGKGYVFVRRALPLVDTCTRPAAYRVCS